MVIVGICYGLTLCNNEILGRGPRRHICLVKRSNGSSFCFWTDIHFAIHTKLLLHNTILWFNWWTCFRIHTICSVNLHLITQLLLFIDQWLSKHHNSRHTCLSQIVNSLFISQEQNELLAWSMMLWYLFMLISLPHYPPKNQCTCIYLWLTEIFYEKIDRSCGLYVRNWPYWRPFSVSIIPFLGNVGRMCSLKRFQIAWKVHSITVLFL